MKMTFKVTFADGTETEVRPLPLAWIGWEVWSGRKMSDLGEKGVGMGDMCRLAWEQVHLSGNGTGYDEWVATLTDIATVDEEDPTPGDEAPSTG